MLKTELEIGIESPLNEYEYNVINTVYMDYPFEDKEQIYALYRICGYNIFVMLYLEMQHRVKRIKLVRDCPTCDLVEELGKRDGVKKMKVVPHEKYAISVGNANVVNIGSASVYLVID